MIRFVLLAVAVVLTTTAAHSQTGDGYKGADYAQWDHRKRGAWMILVTEPLAPRGQEMMFAMRAKSCLDEALTSRNSEERQTVEMFMRTPLSELTRTCALMVAAQKR